MQLYAKEGCLGSKDEIWNRVKVSFEALRCFINPFDRECDYILFFFYYSTLVLLCILISYIGLINPILVVIDYIVLTPIMFFFIISIVRKLEERKSKLIYADN